MDTSSTSTKLATGEAIRLLLGHREMTQMDLAAAAGVGRAHISRIVTGDIAKPNAKALIRIARALSVSLDLLLTPPESAQALLDLVDADSREPAEPEPAPSDSADASPRGVA